MATGRDILTLACRELGTKEVPANSNNVKYNTWYYGKPVNGSAYPWCMAFVQWCYEMAGATLPFKTASCGALLRWYQNNAPECVKLLENGQAGDIVIFDFPGGAATDHTGILEGFGTSTVTTIDGNTGATSDANGGSVMRRTRARSTVLAVIHPHEIDLKPGKEVNMDIEQLIRGMTDEQAYKIYCKAENHMAKLPLPVSWNAKEQVAAAISHGVTDGARPMVPARRYEAALMADRK